MDRKTTIGHNKYVINAKLTKEKLINLKLDMLGDMTNEEMTSLVYDLIGVRDLIGIKED